VKKIFKVSITIIVLVLIICSINKLYVLGLFDLNVTEEQLAGYSEYYFKQLDSEEKRMYINIDRAIKARKDQRIVTNKITEDIQDKILNVITAYFYDNPECFYLQNKYKVIIKNYLFFQIAIVQLEYSVDNKMEIDRMEVKLQNEVDNILNSCLKPGMTAYQKELAIHDALVESVSYYMYKSIDNIPSLMHSAYGAIVQKQSVCDGYSRAYKILLKEAGISSIIISGVTDNTLHAWNLVKLDDEYYHVDVTSDKLEDEFEKYAVHTYFNLTDEQISLTHTKDNQFKLPVCNSNKYDYYVMNGCYISYEDNLFNKLGEIIARNKNSDTLEIKVDDRYTSRSIIDTLYELDFSNWRTNRKTSISYSRKSNVYIFINSK